MILKETEIYKAFAGFKKAERDMLEYYKLKPDYKVKVAKRDAFMTLSNSDVSIAVNVELKKTDKWSFDKKMEAIICELDGEKMVLWFDKTFDVQELITGKASDKQRVKFSGIQF